MILRITAEDDRSGPYTVTVATAIEALAIVSRLRTRNFANVRIYRDGEEIDEGRLNTIASLERK